MVLLPNLDGTRSQRHSQVDRMRTKYDVIASELHVHPNCYHPVVAKDPARRLLNNCVSC